MKIDLVADDLIRGSCQALGLGLTDANDRDKSGSKCGLGLCSDGLAGFAMVGAALGMAHDNVRSASVEQHGRADIACMGATRVCVAVLTADMYGAALSPLCGPMKQRRRWANKNLTVDIAGFFKKSPEAGNLFQCRAGSVHLPVSGNQWPQSLLHPYPNNTLHAHGEWLNRASCVCLAGPIHPVYYARASNAIG